MAADAAISGLISVKARAMARRFLHREGGPAMPQNLTVDPLALTALGFLGGVLLLTLGLFVWLMLPKRDRARRDA